MKEQELRALVRDAVARHLGGRSAAGPSLATTATPAARAPHGAAAHASHALYLTVVNPGEACVIEPSVSCDHCGYCRSHGH